MCEGAHSDVIPLVPWAQTTTGIPSIELFLNLRGNHGHSTYAEAGTALPLNVSVWYKKREMETSGATVYSELLVLSCTASTWPGPAADALGGSE